MLLVGIPAPRRRIFPRVRREPQYRCSKWTAQRLAPREKLLPGGICNRDSEGGLSGKCFRLIDFGRTERRDALDERKQQELMSQNHETLLQWLDERTVLNQR